MCTGVKIGFSEMNYNVGESSGEVWIVIEVRDGNLQRELIINLSTYDETASGKHTAALTTLLL